MRKCKMKVIAMVMVMVMSFLFTGCGSTKNVEKKEIKDNTSAGLIDYETSRLGIDSNKKDFEESLVSGTYYVVHEGIYYPAYTYLKNEAADSQLEMTSYLRTNPNRMSFYTLENVIDIPTLFPGDHLVYYSTSDMLDCVLWERYKDLGATFGVRNLQKNKSGKYYADLTTDEECVIPDSELYDFYKMTVDNVMIDKVGGVVVNDDVVQDGIIIGATKGKTYDMEVYTGTYYKHYNAVANIEAMKAYELFASIDIETLQDCFWEIDIPEYFVTGYYDVNGTGMIRIVKEPNYSEETDYNVQLLFPDKEETYGSVSDDEDQYVAPAMYSEVPELNYFTTSQNVGTLGYVDPEAEENEAEAKKDELVLPDASKFKEANSIEYDLWFPEGKLCTIRIKSKSGETTGQAVVEFENGASSSLSYNRFDQVYEMTVNGKGNKGKITISGFWFDYDIELTNVEVYKNQDAGIEQPMDSDAGVEESADEDASEDNANSMESLD